MPPEGSRPGGPGPDDSSRRTTRRAVLVALGTAATAGLAGCNGVAGPPGATSERTTGDTGGSGPATGRGTSAPDAALTRDPPTVSIPGGRYTVGSDDGPTDARPAHEVELAPFAIDRYEVTNGQLVAFLRSLGVDPLADAPAGGVEPSDLPPGWRSRLLEGPEGTEERPLVALDDEHCRIGIREGRFVVREGFAGHPATEVTWDGARALADWRGARLPTEAEWEAAARGTAGRRYPWGGEPPTAERAVYGRGSGETAPVGTHPAGATPRGVQDLAGNVSEWTSSLYRPYPYDADDGREDPDVRGERVTRGGDHVFASAADLRTFVRAGFSREFDRGHRHIGFRCARPR